MRRDDMRLTGVTGFGYGRRGRLRRGKLSERERMEARRVPETRKNKMNILIEIMA